MQLLVSNFFFRLVVECEQPFVATRNHLELVSDIRALFPRVHDTNEERLQAATPGVRAFDMQQRHPEHKNFIQHRETEKKKKERRKQQKKMCKDLQQPHQNGK